MSGRRVGLSVCLRKWQEVLPYKVRLNFSMLPIPLRPPPRFSNQPKRSPHGLLSPCRLGQHPYLLLL